MWILKYVDTLGSSSTRGSKEPRVVIPEQRNEMDAFVSVAPVTGRDIKNRLPVNLKG